MIWLILLILCLAIAFAGVYYLQEEDWLFFLIPAAIFLIISIILFCGAIYEYPELESKKELYTSLQSEIESVRNASYPQKTNGSLVAGSVENMNQSTVLSTYIAKCSDYKADYNGELKLIQTKLKSNIFTIFGANIWRSNKLTTMKPL